MKRIISTTIAAGALAFASPILALEQAGDGSDVAENSEDEFEILTEEEEAMAEFEREMGDAFALFGEIFKAEPLTPEQEELLPLAMEMTDAIMPEGTFGIIMKDSMEPMMNAMMSAIANNPRIRLAEITGVDMDDLEELDDEAAQEVLDIFDPQFEARNTQLTVVIVDMISQMFDAMEPAYREAYARALATRFSEEEMRELLEFFATQAGSKFAKASFSIQYDPQMMGVMEQMGPAMVEVMPSMMEGFAALEEEFAKERKFSDLSTAERDRAASIIGKSVSELEALQPQEEVEVEDASEFEET